MVEPAVGAVGGVAVSVGVAVGGEVGLGDAVKVGTGVSVWPGWKGVGEAAFGSRVGRRKGAKGCGVGTDAGAAQDAMKMETRKQRISGW